MELELLKLRVHKAEAAAEQAQERLRFQGNILLKWQRKLTDQEALICRLKQERERQMRTIASNLFIVEAELRKEQSQILRLVKEKDELITSQEQQIHALVVLNRKLAAIAGQQQHQRHRKSRSQSCRSLFEASTNEDAELYFDPRRDIVTEQTAVSENGGDKIGVVIFEHYNKENSPPVCMGKINGSDEFSEQEDVVVNNPVRIPWDKSAGRHVPTLEALDEVAEEMVSGGDEALLFCENGGGEENASCAIDKETFVKVKPKGINSQTASFNRVMSTHRNVTKPKDVKYKKINRVKSRSLEELRGKLRNWTHPFFVSEKFT